MIESNVSDSIRSKTPIRASEVLEDFQYEEALIVGVTNKSLNKGTEFYFIVQLHVEDKTTEILLPTNDFEMCKYEEKLNEAESDKTTSERKSN